MEGPATVSKTRGRNNILPSWCRKSLKPGNIRLFICLLYLVLVLWAFVSFWSFHFKCKIFSQSYSKSFKIAKCNNVSCEKFNLMRRPILLVARICCWEMSKRNIVRNQSRSRNNLLIALKYFFNTDKKKPQLISYSFPMSFLFLANYETLEWNIHVYPKLQHYRSSELPFTLISSISIITVGHGGALVESIKLSTGGSWVRLPL